MGFGRIFFFIFGFALLEVLVLAKVASLIGWPITIVATVVTALLGSYLFRRQGLETWIRLNQRMQQGDMPGQEMVEGIMLLLGGALLITPGFITDAVGFALLLPGSRRAMARKVIEKGTLQGFTTMQGGGFTYSRYTQQGPNPFQQPPRQDDGNVTIEGEAHREKNE
ncbi:FxsA family protein [Alcanivorax sp. IL3]|uniref:FxsA family protein n=1 Tax=unclassified Alcanivorax TaxID=2638842 RepID=UPI0039C13353